MAERDPFGRLADENPLAGLGSLSEAAEVGARPEPVVSARPAADEEAERPKPRPRPDARRLAANAAAGAGEEKPRSKPSAAATPQQQQLRELLGAVEQMKRAKGMGPGGVGLLRTIGRVISIVRFVAVLVIVVAIGTVALGVFSSGAIKDRITELPAIELPSELQGPRNTPSEPEPVGLRGKSLLAQRNLSRALRRLATSGLGRLTSMTIRSERLDVQLLTKGGRRRNVQLRSDGELRKLSLSGGGFARSRTIPFSQVSSAAPGRLARSAAGRLKRPASQVDYVALISAGRVAGWTVVMKNDGKQFLADARGRIIG